MGIKLKRFICLSGLVGLLACLTTAPWSFLAFGAEKPANQVHVLLLELAPHLPNLNFVRDIAYDGSYGRFAEKLETTAAFRNLPTTEQGEIEKSLVQLQGNRVSIFYGLHRGDEYPRTRPRIAVNGTLSHASEILKSIIDHEGLYRFFKNTGYASIQIVSGKDRFEILDHTSYWEFTSQLSGFKRPEGNYIAVMGAPYNEFTAPNGWNYYDADQNLEQRAMLQDLFNDGSIAPQDRCMRVLTSGIRHR